jgi:ribose transport system permease protein
VESATILNIMNLVGIQSQPQLVIKGLVILVAVFFSVGTVSGGSAAAELRRRLWGAGQA